MLLTHVFLCFIKSSLSTDVTNCYIDTSQKKELDYSEKESEEKEKNEKKMRYDAFQEIVLMTKNILKSTSFPKNKSL